MRLAFDSLCFTKWMIFQTSYSHIRKRGSERFNDETFHEISLLSSFFSPHYCRIFLSNRQSPNVTLSKSPSMAQGSKLMRVNQIQHICLTFFEGQSQCAAGVLLAHILHIQKFIDDPYLVHDQILIVMRIFIIISLSKMNK